MKRLILILSLVSLACVLQTAPAAVVDGEAPLEADGEVVPTPTPEIVLWPDKLTPIATRAIQTYTVTASTLYVRDKDGEVTCYTPGNCYLHRDDLVACVPTDSGWCLMRNGRRVWAGCLDPNPEQLECEAR